MNNKLKTKSFIPSLKDEEGCVADSDEDKANLLNATFHKVFKNDDGTDLTSDCLLSTQQCLPDFYISEEDVSSAMHNRPIPDKLSRTPDGIPAYFWTILLKPAGTQGAQRSQGAQGSQGPRSTRIT